MRLHVKDRSGNVRPALRLPRHPLQFGVRAVPCPRVNETTCVLPLHA